MVVTFASLAYARQFSAIGYFMSDKKKRWKKNFIVQLIILQNNWINNLEQEKENISCKKIKISKKETKLKKE